MAHWFEEDNDDLINTLLVGQVTELLNNDYKEGKSFDSEEIILAEEKELTWLKARWGKLSGSEIYKLLTGDKEPKIVDIENNLKENALMVIKGLPKSKFSTSTGLPDLRAINSALKMAGSKGINALQRNMLADLAIPPEQLSQGAKAYIESKAIEKMTVFIADDFFKSKAIEWGNANELGAIKATEKRFNIKITDTGENQQSIEIIKNWVSHTPDGTILLNGKKGRIEVKCPNTKTHVKYLEIKNADDLKKIEFKYYCQTQHYFLDESIKFVIFASHDPRFKQEKEEGVTGQVLVNEKLKTHTVLIEPNYEFIELMKKKQLVAIRYGEEFMRRLKEKETDIDKATDKIKAFLNS
jgi:hypothetical protein